MRQSQQETRQATADELARMRRLVRQGLEEGAVGVSSGLDYIPSRYADTAELVALCRELGPGRVYVTHMRGYAPQTVLPAMEEVFRIGRETGAPVHISHFNSQAALVLPVLDAARAAGVDATFDLYEARTGRRVTDRRWYELLAATYSALAVTRVMQLRAAEGLVPDELVTTHPSMRALADLLEEHP